MAALKVFKDPKGGPPPSPVPGDGIGSAGSAGVPAPRSPSTGSHTGAGSKVKKLDLSDLSAIQRSVTEERNKLRHFVIKAKQDYEERKERSRTSGGSTGNQIGMTDDEEYFSATVGEQFGPDGATNLRVEAAIGRGVFSSVYHCKDVKEDKDYAVKFIRSNPMMRKAAEKEVEMYRRLAKYAPREDAEGANHLINLASVGTFEHSGHLCFVFDLLKCDMRFALQKYGQGAGLPLPTLSSYVRQIFLGLRTLRKLKVIHADLKPDNLLLTMNKAEVQICDFGSAMDVSETVRTSYAQPRYYRAPEIMLGMAYDMQIDVWSAGTTLFELATGKILFTGKTNNQMLKQMIGVCGGFSKRMATEGEFARKHFNSDGDFLHKDESSITGEPVVMAARLAKPTRPVSGLLQAQLTVPAEGVHLGVHEKWVAQLAELVTACLRPDPRERIQPAEALDLPFFKKDR